MSTDKLINKGFLFVNLDKANNDTKAIVVIGSARGGTSLVAGALHHLGVFTGEKSNPPVFEDVMLSDAYESGDEALVEDIIEKYSSEHDIWAWKRPSAINYLGLVEKTIPNPFYIFIFKDIFSIANRNNISMQMDVISGLNRAVSDYKKIVDFSSSLNKPMMFVSADKVLANKEQFVDALISAFEIDADYVKRQRTLDFITPNPVAYLDVTRNTKVKGVVDRISKKVISGWVKGIHDPNPIEVEVWCDGCLIKQTVANIHRKDLKSKNIHRTGDCGFYINVEKDIPDGEVEIVVKAKGDIKELKNGKKIVLDSA